MAACAAADGAPVDLGTTGPAAGDVHWFATGDATAQSDAASIDAATRVIAGLVAASADRIDSIVAVLHRDDPRHVLLGVWRGGVLTLDALAPCPSEAGEWAVTAPPRQLTMVDLDAIAIPRSIRSGDDDVEARRRSVLAAFSDAWGRRDIDTLLSLMSAEPTYRGSTGPFPGTSFVGIDEVRAGFKKMLGGDPIPRLASEPQPVAPEALYVADKVITFWSLPFTTADGTVTEVQGVDLLTFDADDRIRMKDAYRKAFP